MPTPRAPKKRPENGNGKDLLTPDELVTAALNGVVTEASIDDGFEQGLIDLRTLKTALANLEGRKKTEPTYIFPDGTVLRVSPPPILILESLRSEEGKPEAPTRKLMVVGGAVIDQKRGDDEPVLNEEQIAELPEDRQAEERAYATYREQLSIWGLGRLRAITRHVFLLCIKDDPPEEAIKLFTFLGYTDPFERKVAWMSSKVPRMDDIDTFIEALTAMYEATEEAIAEAEALFRRAVEARSRRVERDREVAAAPAAEAEG